MKQTGAQTLRERTQAEEASTSLGNQMIADFLTMLDAWHAASEVYDDELDVQIHKWYADFLKDHSRKVWPTRDVPYFSPSSANSCHRALYEKMRGAKRDITGIQPHQRRWAQLGTAVGDSIQRDILFIEKHFESKVGTAPKFRLERNGYNEPMFEDFAKKSHVVEHKGKQFSLFGTCDGILLYQTEDGEVIRMGLEIKSKQTTSTKTSHYSMRAPETSHIKQCVAYSLMYEVDHYIILYVNASKKSWSLTDEEYAKNPDIRAFHVHITERDKQTLLDELTDVMQAVEDGNPPPIDPEKWLFNSYKTAILRSMSDEEFTELNRMVVQVMQSGLSYVKKREYGRCLEDIVRVREGENIRKGTD